MAGSTRINDSHIVTNRTTGGCIGGGVTIPSGVGTFSNCNFRFNRGDRGGGIYAVSLTLYNCTFIGNSTIGVGGAVNCSGSVNVEYCSFTSNSASRGAAIDFGSPTVMTMRNCLLYGNSASGTTGGGGINSRYDSRVTIESSTIVSNVCTGSGSGGGILLDRSPNNVFRNCLIYFNTADSGPDIYAPSSDASLSNTFEYCCINSNLSLAVSPVTNDPQLVSAVGGNCHLTENSPCVNAGSNQAWMATAMDLDDRSRIDHFHNVVDMGAYEFHFKGMIFKSR